MNMTTMELTKALENGEVMATELLPLLALQLNKTFVPTERMLQGPQAAIERMKNSFQELAKVAGDAGFREGVANFANALNNFASSENTKVVIEGIANAFLYLSKNVELVTGTLTTGLAVFFAMRSGLPLVAGGIGGLSTAFAGLATVAKTLAGYLVFTTQSAALNAAFTGMGTAAGVLGKAFTMAGAAVRWFGRGLIWAAKAAVPLLAAGFAGFQLGEFLYKEFELVRRFGNNLAELVANFMAKATNLWEKGWEWFATIPERFLANVAHNLVDQLTFYGGLLSKFAGLFSDDLAKGITDFTNSLSGGILSSFKTEIDAVAESNKKLAESDRRLIEEFDFINESFKETREELNALADKANELNIGIGVLEVQTREKAQADVQAAKALEMHEKSVKSLEEAVQLGKYSGMVTKMKEFSETVADIEDSANPTIKKIRELTKDIAELAKQTSSGGMKANTEAINALIEDQVKKYTKLIEIQKKIKDGDSDAIGDVSPQQALDNNLMQLAAIEGKIAELEDTRFNFDTQGLKQSEKALVSLRVQLERVKQESSASFEALDGDVKSVLKSGKNLNKYVKYVEDFNIAIDERSEKIAKIQKNINTVLEGEGKRPQQIVEYQEAINGLVGRLKTYEEQAKKLKAVGMPVGADIQGDIDKTKAKIDELTDELEDLYGAGDKAAVVLNQLGRELDLASMSKSDLAFIDMAKAIGKQYEKLGYTKEAYSLYNTELERTTYIQARMSNLSNEQAQSLAAIAVETDKATKEAEKLKSSWERVSDLFKDGGEFSLDNLAKGFGDILSSSIANEDWKGLGKGIMGMFGQGLTSIAATAIGGPLGSVLGSAVGGVVDLAINKLFGGDYVDPTAERQDKQGTGTVLGEINTKSESIAKATQIAADASEKLVGINTNMLSALRDVQAGIMDLTTTITKSFGGVNIEAPSIDPTPGRVAAATVLGGIGGGAMTASFGGVLTAGLSLLNEEVGEFIFDTIDFFTFGLFEELAGALGGSSKKVDEGVRIVGGNITDLINNTVIEGFNTFKVREGVWQSYRNKDVFQELGDDVGRQVTGILDSMVKSISEGAKILGTKPEEIQKALNNFVVETQMISLEGLSAEEQNAALNEVFSTIFDGLAEAVIPNLSEFQRAGEGLGETLGRVSTSLQVAQEASSYLGFAFDGSAQSAVNLVDTVGGVNELADGIIGFVDTFGTEFQKFELAEKQFTNALDNAGLGLAKNREEYFNLIQAQDANTESGAKNIAILLSLADAADAYYSQQETWTEQITDRYNDLLGREPDPAGLQFYIEALEEGAMTIDEIAEALKNSVEGIDFDQKGTREDIEKLYKDIFDREPDTDGWDYWTKMVKESGLTIDQVAEAMKGSTEGLTPVITELYRDVLGREPDTEGLMNWIKAVQAGDVELEDVAAHMSKSFESLAPKLNEVAEEFLGREFDTESLEWYTKAIQEGAITFDEAAKQIANSQEALIYAARDEYISLSARELELLGNSEKALAITRARELEDVNPLNRELQLRVWALEDEAAELQSLNDLTIRLLEAEGKSTEALAMTRQMEYENASISERKILDQIYAQEDLNRAKEEQTALDNLTVRLLNLQGKGTEALSITRAQELATASEAEKAILKQIYAQEDLNAQLEQANKLDNLQIRLLNLQDKSTEALAITRKLEMATATDAEKVILKQIYAQEDLNKAKEDQLKEFEKEADSVSDMAERISKARDDINSAYEDEIRNLESMKESLSGLAQELRDFNVDIKTGDLSALSPQRQYEEARRAFESTSTLARQGDITAIERLTDVSKRFLEESREFQGSGGTYAEDFRRVTNVIDTTASVAEIEAARAQAQQELMERQLEAGEAAKEELANIKEAITHLLDVQKESNIINNGELNQIKFLLSSINSETSLQTELFTRD